LPEFWRLHWNSTLLDPIGWYFIKDRFLGRVPLKVGCIERADQVDGRGHVPVDVENVR